jgi:hypothetical protein
MRTQDPKTPQISQDIQGDGVETEYSPARMTRLTRNLDNVQALAYLRLLDHIVIAGGWLRDDAAELARVSRCPEREWPRVKAALLRRGLLRLGRDGVTYGHRHPFRGGAR